MGTTYNSRIRDGPLRSSPNAFVQLPFVGVISAVRVGQEEGVDAASLEELCQFDPVFQRALGGGFIFGILSGMSVLLVVCGYVHTFHWPGDKCPTVDMSNALRRICFFSWLLPSAALVSPILATVYYLSPAYSVDVRL
jgi:hypothetical protein